MPDIELIPEITTEVTPPLITAVVTPIPTIGTTIDAIAVEVTATPLIEVAVNAEIPELVVEFEAIAITQGEDAVFTEFLPLGENIESNKLVYLDSGLLYKAESNDEQKVGVVGILTQAGQTGNSRFVITGGNYSFSGWNWSLSTGNPGNKIYLSTDGQLTQTVPTTNYQVEIGYPISPTKIVIDIEEPIKL